MNSFADAREEHRQNFQEEYENGGISVQASVAVTPTNNSSSGPAIDLLEQTHAKPGSVYFNDDRVTMIVWYIPENGEGVCESSMCVRCWRT